MSDPLGLFDTDNETQSSPDPLGLFDTSTPKRKTTLAEDAKIGIASMGNMADSILSLATTTLATPFASTEEIDDILRNMDARAQQRNQWANPEQVEQNIPGAIVSGITGLPGTILAPASGVERARDLVQKGESVPTALGAGAVDSILSTAALAIPGSFGKGIISKVGTGAASNAGLGAATDAATVALAKQQETKDAYNPLDITRRAAEAATGGAFGALSKGRSKPGKADLTKLDDLDRISPDKPSGKLPDTGPDSEYYLRKYEERQKALAYDVPKPDDLLQRQRDMEVKERNKEFFDAREQDRQANQGPDVPEGFYEAQRNKEFLDELNSRRNENQGPPLPNDYYTKLRNQEYLDSLNKEREAFQGPPKPYDYLETSRNREFIESQQKLRDEFQGPNRPYDYFEKQKNQQFLDEFKAKSEEASALQAERDRADEIINQQREQAQAESQGIEADIRAAKELAHKDHLENLKQLAELQNEKYQNQLNVEPGLKPKPEITGSVANRYVPKSQRGGIDIDSIIKSFGAGINNVKRTFNRIPGHEDTGVNMLTDYPNMEKAKADILSQAKNTKVKAASLKPGSSYVGQLSGDPLIKTGVQFLQTARKIADHNIQRFVQPIEKIFQKAKFSNKSDLVELAALFKKEMQGKRTYTPEQLAQARFSPKQIELYQKLREGFDNSWKAQNESLKAMGLPELSKHEAYLSSRWDGDWSSHIYDKNGKLVWVVKDRSKKGVERALEYLKENGIDFDPKQSKVEFSDRHFNTPSNLAAAYASMIQHVSEGSPLAQKARELLEGQISAKAYKTLGQDKHFQNKMGVRGYVGDRPWVDPVKDAVDMFDEQIRYMKNAYEWSELNNASDKLKGLLADPEIMKQSPDSVQYMKGQMDRVLGRGDKQVFSKLEGLVAKSFGRSRNDINRAVNLGKTGFVLQKLGLNTSNMIANVLQFTNTLPWHRVLSNEGYSHNAAKTTLLTTNDTLAGLARHYGEAVTGKRSGAFMTPLGEKALQYAEDNGILSKTSMDEHTDLQSSQAQLVAQKYLGWGITTPDKISRFSAFLGFAHHLEQSGKFKDPMDIFREAEQWTNATMVDPNKAERPWIVQDTGTLGNIGYTLQSYTANYLNQAASLAHRAATKNEIAPLGIFLANSAALAGLGGMFGVQPLMDAYDKLRETVADKKPELFDKLPDARKWMVDLGDSGPIGRMAAHGVASELTGANMGTKFEVNPSLPGGWLGDMGKQAGAVAGAIANPNSETAGQALHSVLPAGLGQGTFEVDSGVFNTGDKYVSPSNMDYRKGVIRSDKQKLYKRLGFTELTESMDKERMYQHDINDSLNNKYRSSLLQKSVKSLIDGSDSAKANEYINKYIQVSGPQAQSGLQRAIEQELLERKLPAEQLRLLRAKSLSRLNNWVNYYGGANENQ